MTYRVRLALIALTALAAAGLAACGTAASSAASAVPKASADAAGTVSPLAACNSLAAWEDSSASGSVSDDAGLRKTFQDTSQPLSGDFASWTSGMRSGNADVAGLGGKVTSDCAAWNVTIFGAPAPAPSTATATQAPAAETVTFEVSGSDAQVTYGPAGSDTSGTVPMKVTEQLGDPVYYALTAQLQGGGTVSCEIEVGGKVISRATASGGYNIASCEISPDPVNGGWEDTNAA